MPTKIALSLEKIEEPPTVLELKEFGASFSKDEWLKLCSNRQFVSILMENLEQASILSKKILKK